MAAEDTLIALEKHQKDLENLKYEDFNTVSQTHQDFLNNAQFGDDLKQNRKYKKVDALFNNKLGDISYKQKNYEKAFNYFLNAYQKSSEVVNNEFFTESYKNIRDNAHQRMTDCITALIQNKQLTKATELNNKAREKGIAITLNKINMGKLKQGEAEIRKSSQYSNNVLPGTLSESYTSGFLTSSISNHFNKSKSVTIAMLTIAGNDPTFFLSLPFVLLSLVGNLFSPLTGLGHGFFTAATRNLKSKSELEKIPSYLNTFAEADDANKETTINNIIGQYEQKYAPSWANSDSSVELFELLKTNSVSTKEKWAAIDAFMLEPYDRNDKDNTLLKNNGKKMFNIIYDTIAKSDPAVREGLKQK